MTPSEFKAWFDGFTEALDGVPSKAQWARIKKRVSEIDGRPVTERVYVDRYVERRWPPQRYWEYMSQMRAAQNWQSATLNASAENPVVWNGEQAMFALGRAEAASLS